MLGSGLKARDEKIVEWMKISRDLIVDNLTIMKDQGIVKMDEYGAWYKA